MREGLLQTIRENPEDDHLKLIYGDWLEEQGDPACELVRACWGKLPRYLTRTRAMMRALGVRAGRDDLLETLVSLLVGWQWRIAACDFAEAVHDYWPSAEEHTIWDMLAAVRRLAIFGEEESEAMTAINQTAHAIARHHLAYSWPFSPTKSALQTVVATSFITTRNPAIEAYLCMADVWAQADFPMHERMPMLTRQKLRLVEYALGFVPIQPESINTCEKAPQP